MSEPLFVDTSAWFALFDKRDEKHQPAHQFWTQEKGYSYITTNYIIDETLTLIAKKTGQQKACNTGQELYSGRLSKVIQITEDLQQEALEILGQYHDKFFSFTDCTSFAVMKHFSIQKVLSFDSDFTKAGFLTLPSK